MATHTQELLLRIAGRLDRAFGSALEEADRGVSSLGEGLMKAQRQADLFDKVMKKRKGVETMNSRLNAAMEQVAKMDAQMKAAGKSTASQQRAFNAASARADRYRRELDALNLELAEQERLAGTAGKSLEAVSRAHESVASSVKQQLAAIDAVDKREMQLADRAQSAMADRMEGLAHIASGMGVLRTLYVPVEAAMSYETAEKELSKFTDSSTRLMELNLQASQGSALSYNDMADIQAAGLQAGVVSADDVDQIMAYTQIVNRAALAFDMTGEAAGSAFAAIQAQITGSVESTEKMFDVVNAISNVTNASASDLLTVIQRSGGIVKNFTALTNEQIVALSAAFRASSTSAEEAATSQAAFIAALTKGKGATATQIEGFERLGINAEALTAKLLTGPNNAQEAILQLFDSLRMLDETERADVMSKIFGGDKGTLNAIASILGQTDTLLGKPLNVVSSETNYDGSMAAEAAKQAETVANQAAVLDNNLEALKVVVGEDLLPAWNWFLSFLIKSIRVISDVARSNSALVSGVMIFAGALAGIKVAIGSLMIAWGFLFAAFTRGAVLINALRRGWLIYRGVLTAVSIEQRVAAFTAGVLSKAMSALRFVFLSAPKAVAMYTAALIRNAKVMTARAITGARSFVLWLGRSIAQLALSAAGLATHSAAMALNTARTSAAAAASAVFAARAAAGTIALKAWTLAMGVAGKAGAVFTVGIKGLRAAFTALNAIIRANPLGLLLTVISLVVAAGVSLWKNWDWLMDKAGEVWSWFEETFPGAASVVEGAFGLIVDAVDNVKTFISTLIDFVGKVFAGDWEGAWAVVTASFEATWEGFKGIVSGVIDWISGKITWVTDSIAGAWDALTSLFSSDDTAGVARPNPLAGYGTAFNPALNGAAAVSVPNGAVRAVESVSANPLAGYGAAFNPALSGPEAVNVPALASGGVVTAPTLALVGEGNENEAVLPLSKLREFLSLNSDRSPSQGSSPSLNVTFSPVINVSGGGDAYAGVRKALAEGSQSLRRELEALMRDERRRAYD